jgi:hypothetical protein
MEAVLPRWRRLPPGLADHAYHALDSVVGFTVAVDHPLAAQLDDLARKYLATMPIDELPRTAEHVRWHLDSSGGEGARAFESGLDMFLDGLELARTDRSAPEAAARDRESSRM